VTGKTREEVSEKALAMMDSLSYSFEIAGAVDAG